MKTWILSARSSAAVASPGLLGFVHLSGGAASAKFEAPGAGSHAGLSWR
jgi:hypothetical protein